MAVSLFVRCLSTYSLPFYSLTTVIYCSMHAHNKTNHSLNPHWCAFVTYNCRWPTSRERAKRIDDDAASAALTCGVNWAIGQRVCGRERQEARGKRERRTSRNTPTTPTRRSYSLRCLAATTAVSPSMSRLCKIFIARHAEQLSVPIGHALPSLPPPHARQLAREDTRRRAQSRRLPCAPS